MIILQMVILEHTRPENGLGYFFVHQQRGQLL